MATQFIKQRIDDLDGTVVDGDAGESTSFRIGDDVYEIDLSTLNGLQFRACLSPYVDVARHVDSPTGQVVQPSDCPLPDRCVEHDPHARQDEVEAAAPSTAGRSPGPSYPAAEPLTRGVWTSGTRACSTGNIGEVPTPTDDGAAEREVGRAPARARRTTQNIHHPNDKTGADAAHGLVVTESEMRPEPGDVDVLIALDVDGALQRFRAKYWGDETAEEIGKEVQVTTADGSAYFLHPVDDALIDRLDALTRLSRVRLGWLTTWGKDAADSFVPQALGGRLDTGYVIAEPPTARFGYGSWKARALHTELRRLGQPAVVWADDDAVVPELEIGRVLLPAAAQLCLAPKSEIGLTAVHVEAIEEFVRKVLAH